MTSIIFRTYNVIHESIDVYVLPKTTDPQSLFAEVTFKPEILWGAVYLHVSRAVWPMGRRCFFSEGITLASQKDLFSTGSLNRKPTTNDWLKEGKHVREFTQADLDAVIAQGASQSF